MNKAKKISVFFICLLFLTTGCSSVHSSFDVHSEITVISREDGSGTRGAFTELFGVELTGDGFRKDITTRESIVTKQTDVVMVNVESNPSAIGYISLGSMNDTVKPLMIDHAAPSAENVKNGTYPITRPFIVATQGERSPLSTDFLGFILAKEGQAVIAENYITVEDDAPPYAGNRPAGKIVIAGSSSVAPVMEKLREAYLPFNPNATIEIQQSDSSSGITGIIDGTCDIGMSSRMLKENEMDGQLAHTTIALDGIAVIVNRQNPVENLTKEQVKQIFAGEITIWDGIKDE